ncbi:MAG TPA: penicillin-binding transpeptidase domain-containing protein [Bdellovibrionales bacterium]|nr:penicillin-binding transpeptidase domain-containing protein [Bdellovibrionales bacterium]
MSEKFFSRRVFWGLIVLTGINLVAAVGVLRNEGVADGLVLPGSQSKSWFSQPKDQVLKNLSPYIRENKFPSRIDWQDEGLADIEYTLDSEFQGKMQAIFNRTRPDYGAIVAMDAATGEILTMVSYNRRNKGENLALKATFPAASIFKIVTAAAAIDQDKLGANSRIGYGGGNHTLYRRNVEEDGGRWRRYVTVREAFARSINTVFAKMGLFFVGPQTLQAYAERFLFNKNIEADIPIESGQAFIPSDDRWAVAEAASGFTRKNTMSPLQGALMAAAIANDGVIPEPFLVRAVRSGGDTIYKAEPGPGSEPVVEPSSARELRQLMAATITQGTSRKSFRQIVNGARLAGLELGGKTGSLTGTEPAGKYDWFVGYGRSGERKIAISVVTIHERIWRIRSSQVAADFFRHYFNISTSSRRVASYSKSKRSRNAY